MPLPALTLVAQPESLTAVPPLTWALAVSPVVLLLALVLWGRFTTIINASVTVAYSVLVATLSFGAGGLTVAVGLGKGAWVGLWILYVIWPALLMHHLASHVGMTALGRALSTMLPRRTENVLLLAWVLPSFIQGVSGFGTPIAVAAPLLVALGIGKARAVALPLIGYHWAVGFGSMGSSFYMGALTAHLDTPGRAAYAASAAVLLGVNCVLSGVLVALMDGGLAGLRDGWRLLATAGPVMALVQAGAARLEPGIGALCAGASGVAVVFVLRRFSRREAAAQAAHSVGEATAGVTADATAGGTAEDTRVRARAAAVPYALLGIVALAVFLPPALRSWAKGHLLIGPSFPRTSTHQGTVNDAVAVYNPIAVVGHPGTFLLIACAGSVAIWASRGIWTRGAWGPVWRGALKQAWKSSPSVVLLASVAGVLVDSGMVRTVAQGAAVATGSAYPAIAPVVGALGSFITGSTTSSNALFSSLQADVAHLIGDPPADLLAGQLAGGNIGNSLAPVVILLGLSAVGAARRTGEVLRMTLAPAAVLLASAVAGTCLLVSVHH
ncbi:L-lactate permease [Pedococcus sp. KACC 23699]|uniref:L-lactate permease n=1 Tax=Pedococcus sp. KACC 23699 TaxID=3149228 RepID=A0AAU7JP95_9MICO